MILNSCSGSNELTFEDKLRLEYDKNHRLDRYYDLKERYDSRIILYLNKESDRAWIINFMLWLTVYFLPDLPEIAATGGILGIIYAVAWWIGVTLCGGGILAVLAYLGSLFGGIPGIPPAILGIIFLCTMFAVLVNLFKLIM
jgi:hypothetical protein